MISLYHSEFCRIRRASGSFRVKPGTRKSSACYGTPRGSLLYMYDDSFFAPAASAVRLGSDLPPPCPAASHQPAVLCKGSMAAPVSVNAVEGIIQHSLTSGKWQVESGKWVNRVEPYINSALLADKELVERSAHHAAENAAANIKNQKLHRPYVKHTLEGGHERKFDPQAKRILFKRIRRAGQY